MALRYLGIFLGALLLSGCGASIGHLEPPIVDTYGHTQEQITKDQHDCVEIKRNYSPGIMADREARITPCMERRGYVILEPKG